MNKRLNASTISGVYKSPAGPDLSIRVVGAGRHLHGKYTGGAGNGCIKADYLVEVALYDFNTLFSQLPRRSGIWVSGDRPHPMPCSQQRLSGSTSLSTCGAGYQDQIFLRACHVFTPSELCSTQTAARLVPPLGHWRRFEEKRGTMMREELQRILTTPGLSKDVFEQVSKSLG